MDIAELSKKAALKNVVVTNGFINPEPLTELLDVIDAFNVDLKAFTEDFYRTQTMSKLAPVKESLKQIRRSGRHLEITNLVIPGLNDDRSTFEEMVKWISGELGKETVLHLSRYFPTYKSSAPPTSPEDLDELFEMAREYLDYVYLGNVSTSNGQNTYCPSCGEKVIDRSRYDTWISGLDKEGNCEQCGFRILENI
jgi:pyruvate formate lyase activating enzyme